MSSRSALAGKCSTLRKCRLGKGEVCSADYPSQRQVASACAVLAALSAAVLAAPPAYAHDAVIASTPGDNQVVDQFPHSISLEFSGNPRENFNTVAISDADAKKVLYTHAPTVTGNLVSLEIPAEVNPGPGNYIIGFQITSSDGHSTRGKTSFSVTGSTAGNSATADGTSSGQIASDESAAASSETDTPRIGAGADGTKIPAWAYWLGGALIVIIAAVVTAINRKA